MRRGGYVRHWREILQKRVWKELNHEQFRVFYYMVESAAGIHMTDTCKRCKAEIRVPRGALLVSERTISRECRVGRTVVRSTIAKMVEWQTAAWLNTSAPCHRVLVLTAYTDCNPTGKVDTGCQFELPLESTNVKEGVLPNHAKSGVVPLIYDRKMGVGATNPKPSSEPSSSVATTQEECRNRRLHMQPNPDANPIKIKESINIQKSARARVATGMPEIGAEDVLNVHLDLALKSGVLKLDPITDTEPYEAVVRLGLGYQEQVDALHWAYADGQRWGDRAIGWRHVLSAPDLAATWARNALKVAHQRQLADGKREQAIEAAIQREKQDMEQDFRVQTQRQRASEMEREAREYRERLRREEEEFQRDERRRQELGMTIPEYFEWKRKRKCAEQDGKSPNDPRGLN